MNVTRNHNNEPVNILQDALITMRIISVSHTHPHTHRYTHIDTHRHPPDTYTVSHSHTHTKRHTKKGGRKRERGVRKRKRDIRENPKNTGKPDRSNELSSRSRFWHMLVAPAHNLAPSERGTNHHFLQNCLHERRKLKEVVITHFYKIVCMTGKKPRGTARGLGLSAHLLSSCRLRRGVSRGFYGGWSHLPGGGIQDQGLCPLPGGGTHRSATLTPGSCCSSFLTFSLPLFL